MQEEYPARWELVDNSTVKNHANQLLRYFGSGDDVQVDCIIFNQLYGYTDKTSGNAGCHTGPEHKMKDKTTTKEFLKTVSALQGDLSQPLDDVVFFHRPSGLIITGHHFEISKYSIVLKILLLDKLLTWIFFIDTLSSHVDTYCITGYLPKGYELPEELQFSGGFFFQRILPGMYFKENRYDTSLGTHVKRIRDMKVHSEQWQEVMKW